jgi:hypothetical protein
MGEKLTALPASFCECMGDDKGKKIVLICKKKLNFDVPL